MLKSLVIKGTQVTTTTKYHQDSYNQKADNNKYCQGCGETETLIH